MWSVRLTDSQRDALTGLLRAQSELGLPLAGALEELELARWDELPDAELPWDRVEELAAAQGIDEADVVWDLCGGYGRARSSAHRGPRRVKRPAPPRTPPRAPRTSR